HVAVAHDQVGELAGFERADVVGSAQQFGAVACGRAQPINGWQAEAHHQGQLARVVAMDVEGRARVRAHTSLPPTLHARTKVSCRAASTARALAIAHSATRPGGDSRKPRAEHSVTE